MRGGPMCGEGKGTRGTRQENGPEVIIRGDS